MHGNLYLALRYLQYHRLTTLVLLTAITLMLFLPAALQVIVQNATRHFGDRAATTPLVVGPRGSALELVLTSVYFDHQLSDYLRMEEMHRIEALELAHIVPLHVRFRARGFTIVGTTPAYFELRGLQIAKGQSWNMIGQCVIGSRVANELGLNVGDRLPVSTERSFALDDAPLRLLVTGVLKPTETPDDGALFVDLDTAWIIEGLGHGHADNTPHGSPAAAEYTDVSPTNASRFHFHGDRSQYPITAMIAVAHSKKDAALLQARYIGSDNLAQIVRPSDVIARLLKKMVRVQSYIIAIVAVVSLTTLLTIALVIALSIRLRQREMLTMSRMGCSRTTIASILGGQIAIVLMASCIVASLLTVVVDLYGRELVQWIVL